MSQPTGRCRPPLLLVHGAYHGGWCFDPARPALNTYFTEIQALTFPDAGAVGGEPQALLASHVAQVREAAAAMSAPPIAVGHSMAGAVLRELDADRDAPLAGLIYVTAYVPAKGTCIMDYAKTDTGSEMGSAMRLNRETKIATLDPAAARHVLYGGCPNDVADACLACLRPQDTGLFKARVAADASQHHRPVHYIACAADRAIGITCQRQMAVAAGISITTIESDHSPFVSMPDVFAATLVRTADALADADRR